MFKIYTFLTKYRKLIEYNIDFIAPKTNDLPYNVGLDYQHIIYFFKYSSKLYLYAGDTNYLSSTFSQEFHTEQYQKMLNKTVICCIIKVRDEKDFLYLKHTRNLYTRKEKDKMPTNSFIAPIKEEEMKYSNDDLYNISSWGADLSFRELVAMYDEGELLKPELQRKYVWTKDEASRFIDSILLGLPVPSIFLAKEQNEKKLIVDGYQRIMTVYDYIKGEFSDTKKIFKLSNTSLINKKWRGKCFDELSEDEQRRIRSTTIHAIIFEQKYPNNDTGMYQVFERINTSGKILKPQEIRNCVYQGSLNTLLFKLNKNDKWRAIIGQQEDSRMADIELILRFFAIRDLIKSNTDVKQINLTKQLNIYMGKLRNVNEEESQNMETDFNNIVSLYYSELGIDAFRNYVPDKDSFTKKVNPTIFDALCIAADRAIKNNIDIHNVKSNYKCLLQNQEFIKASTNRTTNLENINLRVNIAYTILFGNEHEC